MFLAGCGAGAGPARYDEAAFCDAVAAAWSACCEPMDDVACLDRFFGPVREARAEVSAADAQVCRSGYDRAAGDCGGLTDAERAACARMLVGRLPAGEPCPDPRLCGEGTICAGGTCFAEGDLGDPCVPFSCRRGLYCNANEAVCRDLRNDGDACEVGPEPQCRSDLRCVDSRCASGLPDSAPCTDGAECESGSCEADRCAPTPDPTFCESP